jgi:rsbT antagonist protein RsbS
MPIPILKQGPFLIASVQAAAADDDLLALRDELLKQAVRARSFGVVVDLTVLDVMDSFATRTLQSTAEMLRLRGVRSVVVGIQPSVALAMVQLGLTLRDVPTALDLEEGIELLMDSLELNDRGGV